MRTRLLFTFALAAVGAVISAGAVSAQSSEVLGVGGSGVSIDLPNQGKLPAVGDELSQCSNGIDDDEDGTVDLEDASCEDALDDDESDEPMPPPAPPIDDADQNGGSGDGDRGKGNSGPGKLPGIGNPFDESKKKKGKGGKGPGKDESTGSDEKSDGKDEIRKPDGAPTRDNPSVSIAPFGPTPIGVPNFIIDQFTIPPFLLPIYQACGTQYGIPWQVLASINRIETAFGTNLNVSTAGAVGWMQFLPSTWKAYGVDANLDGRKDPYNPFDAICGAARYLKASGGNDDLRRAIFAYNRADWYVDEVLLYARQYGKLPTGLVNSLTGLTEGAHFPVAAKARYADDISERKALERSIPQKGADGNVADVISDSPTRRGIDIFAREGASVVAVNDGTIKKVGKSRKLGRYVVLADAYGNEFTYARLGEVAETVPVPKDRDLTSADFKIVKRDKDGNKVTAGKAAEPEASGPANTEDARERLYALPERRHNRERADLSGQLDDLLDRNGRDYESFKSFFSGVLRFNPKTMEARPLRKGSKVIAGTVLGKIGGEADGVASHVHFAIEPAGRGSRKIDPKPILDGWKLLEATAIYRAAGKDPFNRRVSVGQILLMSKAQLQQRVLRDPDIEIYSCGREDIRTGQIDRRVLATMAYLSERGFRPTVTSLKCGRATVYTKSGNVSHHVSGNAVDIARLNGLPVLGNQGSGSITEAAVLDLLKLQGPLLPAQIITLMEMGGPTYAMADHADHIHVGFYPNIGPGEKSSQRFSNLLDPDQWDKLLNRIGKLDQPEVPTDPSKFALPSRAGRANVGE